MTNKFLYSFAIIAIFFLPSKGKANPPYYYVVKDGDVLSQILFKLQLSPIYGKKGNLKQVLRANQKIGQQKNGDLLISGNRIYFSEEDKEYFPLSEIAVSDAGEITFLPAHETKPSPAPIIETKAKSKPKPHVSLNLLLSFLKIEGTASNGSKGTLATDLVPGMGMNSQFYLSETVSLEFGIRSQWIRMNESEGRILENEVNSLERFSAGVSYKVNSYWTIGAEIGQSDQIFYRALDNETIKVEKAPLQFTQTNFDFIYFNKNNLLLSSRIAHRLHLPFKSGAYKGGLGNGYLISLNALKTFKGFIYYSEIFYSHDRFPLEIIDFTRNETGLVLGIKYYFPE
jgi:hypothetical protein